MSERFEMRVDDELMLRIDRARGLVPRAAWIKDVVEKALGGHSAEGGASGVRPVTPSPASSRPRVSSAKAGIQPIPKGGK